MSKYIVLKIYKGADTSAIVEDIQFANSYRDAIIKSKFLKKKYSDYTIQTIRVHVSYNSFNVLTIKIPTSLQTGNAEMMVYPDISDDIILACHDDMLNAIKHNIKDKGPGRVRVETTDSSVLQSNDINIADEIYQVNGRAIINIDGNKKVISPVNTISFNTEEDGCLYARTKEDGPIYAEINNKWAYVEQDNNVLMIKIESIDHMYIEKWEKEDGET